MKIASNKISAVIKFYKEQLRDLYAEDEIESFIRLSFKHFLHFSPIDLVLKQQENLSESELLKFNFVVKDLKKQKPIQYILGETEFYGFKIKVDSSVLIPRPETEELVDWIITDFEKEKTGLKIADICTGSGCIAIALQKKLPLSEVKAIDISEKALGIAKKNAKINRAEIFFSREDVLKGLKTGNKYDIIVSNPPYVMEKEKKWMRENVLAYEPHIALFVKDNDALKFYRKISKWALENMSDKGNLYFEINESMGDALIKLLDDMGYKEITLRSDLSKKHRMIRCSLQEN